MNTIKVPYEGKGYAVKYKVETIDMSMTPVSYLNVYSVFVEDEALQKITGEHFSILHHPTVTVMPLYDIKTAGDIAEVNLKKAIAQQIMNNPTQ